MKRLDLTANIAVIVTSVALLGFIGNSWYESHRAPRSSTARAQALVGTPAKLTGVDFTRKDKTLLIAISSSELIDTCSLFRAACIYRNIGDLVS